MNFFASQDLARRNTRLLIALFAIAIAFLALLTNLLLIATARLVDPLGILYIPGLDYEVFAYVSLFVVAIIVTGSLIRLRSLRRGGAMVAASLDGQLVVPGTDDPRIRLLLNIVEEMAIASGLPVPPVYLIPEPGINAFAAGYLPGDAVIGVTCGAIDGLDRDQLQGVVAHEFSHILNGDMRLNMRLMGTLYGIQMLALMGRTLASPVGQKTAPRHTGSGSGSVLGLGMFAVGYLGYLCARLIKAAVSRQREFLADASAVAFTRNPASVAGALKRIGGSSTGSVLENPRAEELSHAFFSSAIKVGFTRFLSTHPPLEERIRRIEPHWKGDYTLDLHADADYVPVSPNTAAFTSFSPAADTTGDTLVNSVGQTLDITAVHELIQGIPPPLRDATHEPYTARSVVYLLLLNEDEATRQQQLSQVEASGDLGVYAALQNCLDQFPVATKQRLLLLEMALPSLRQLSGEQYHLFRHNIDALISVDSRVSLPEWSLRKFITHNLDPVFGRGRNPRNLTRLPRKRCAVLLSMLAHSEKQRAVTPEEAFNAGRYRLGMSIPLLARSVLNLKKLDLAVDCLAGVPALKKPRLLKACIAVTAVDGIISAREQELVRTISYVLDCPMPPFVEVV